jgi:hypothetical protein
MIMKKINYYIGSNNTTKMVEKDKALEVLSRHYEGMSISDIMGVWHGTREASIMVSIMADTADLSLIRTACKELNTVLDQEAIMVEVLESNTIFINDR